MPAWYTTTSTKKKKQVKYRTAEAKQRADRERENWEKLIQKHNPERKKPTQSGTLKNYNLNPPIGRELKHYPSFSSGVGVGLKKQNNQYTGSNIIGIGTLHKSNAVPVFRKEDAEDIAKMRR